MKIGVVTSNPKPTAGGGFSFQHSIITALSQIPTQHQFMILDKSEHHDYVTSDNIPVIGIHPNREQEKQSRHAALRFVDLKRYLPFRASKKSTFKKDSILTKAIKDNSIDLVWFLFPGAEIVPCPMFTTVWDLQHRMQPWFPEISYAGWTWQEREDNYQKILPRSAKIITGTQVGKEEITHLYRIPPENIVVVPFFYPTQTTYTNQPNELIKNKYEINSRFFLYPAQFWPHKNHANLVQAFDIARKRNNTFPELVLTGSDKGNEAYIKNIINELGLNDKIHILGFVPDEDLTALYSCADGLVFPTFFGPDNLPPLEAFALGCPVMASDIPGSREQLGNAAVYFNPAEPNEIADAMLRLHGDEDLKQHIREQGFLRVSKYTVQDYIKLIMKNIDEFEAIIRCWNSKRI